MKLEGIKIKNIRGVEDIEFSTGALTIIAGDNGRGKTSVIEAIRSVFDGGHDETLLRKGEKVGRVELQLDGGRIVKTIKRTGSTAEFIPDGEKVSIKAPQAYINSLATGIPFSPQEFMRASKKERAVYLLKVMPVKISKDEITKATGLIKEAPAADGLDGLSGLRSKLYSERAQRNAEGNQAHQTVKSLKESLPAEPEAGDWGAELREAEAQLEEHAEKWELFRGEAQADCAFGMNEVNAWEGVELQKIREEAALRKRAVRAAFDELVSSREPDKTTTRDAILARIQAAKLNKEYSDRAEGVRRSIDAYIEQSKAATSRAEKLSDAISALDELKVSKLRDLPIEGLVVEGGDVAYNGIEFDALNTATQYGVCFQIAMLTAGELKLMIWDGLAELGDENYAAFCEAARESGHQVIGARLAPGDLAVQTFQ